MWSLPCTGTGHSVSRRSVDTSISSVHPAADKPSKAVRIPSARRPDGHLHRRVGSCQRTWRNQTGRYRDGHVPVRAPGRVRRARRPNAFRRRRQDAPLQNKSWGSKVKCSTDGGKPYSCGQHAERRRNPDGRAAAENTLATIVPAVRCRITPVSSREQVRLDRLESTLASRMVMRYRSDVTGRNDCILFKGLRHNIRGVPRNLENRNRWLELDLEEGVAI